MIVSKIREDKELLSSITSDLKDLGITDYPREEVIQKIRGGEKTILIEGSQPFEEANQTKAIDYRVILKQTFQAGIYTPVSLLVRVAEEPHRSRIFKLSEGEFFTLPQAVNLLHDRPVAKKKNSLIEKSKRIGIRLTVTRRMSLAILPSYDNAYLKPNCLNRWKNCPLNRLIQALANYSPS